MSNDAQPARVSVSPHERRRSARRDVKSLAYIDLGNDTGGIVLNISEGGLAVHSAVALTPRDLPSISFQLPNSSDWVAGGGDIVWLDASRKEAGVRFAALPDGARAYIRNWIASPADDSLNGADTFSGMQLTSLKLGCVPSPREAKSPHQIERPRETEPVDLKLRLHFATRDSASAPSTHIGRGLWWALIFAIGVLAILSFGFGWVAGHGQRDDLPGLLARITGRTVAHAENAPQAPTVTPVVASANAAPQTAPGASSDSSPLQPRTAFTVRAYVPVTGENGQVLDLHMGKLAHRVDPGYPEEALSQHIEGAVQLRATISAEGHVDSVSVVSGDPTLASAAVDAVRQWRYAPTLIDGNPVPIEQAITITFSLPKAN
ncbi:MAG: TonB family protein [Candidatus Acidiferrales bacterium]